MAECRKPLKTRVCPEHRLAMQVSGQPLHETAENVDAFFSRVDKIWEGAVAECRKPLEGKSQDGHNMVLVTHGSVRVSPAACHPADCPDILGDASDPQTLDTSSRQGKVRCGTSLLADISCQTLCAGYAALKADLLLAVTCPVRVQVISAIVCKCLGLGHGRLNQFRFSAGSISVIEFPSPDDLERISVRPVPACIMLVETSYAENWQLRWRCC